MKKYLLFLFPWFLCGCGVHFRAHPSVVFDGDSITAAWAQSWTGQQPTFTANNWLDVGVVGLTCGQIRAGFVGYAVDVQPQAIHLLCGTNDVYPGWQLSDTADQITAMVKEAKQRNIAVVIGTIPPWGPGSLPEKADSSPERFQRIDELNSWITQFAQQQGLQLVDYHTMLEAPNGENYVPALTVDGVHPSAAGYAVMTPAMEQALHTAMQGKAASASTTFGFEQPGER